MPFAAQDPHDETERLRSLRALNLLDTGPEPLFDRLVRLAAAACESPAALFCLVDAHRVWVKARAGVAGLTQTPREQAFCDVTIRGGTGLEVADAWEDDRFRRHPLVCGGTGFRFYAGVPVRAPDGARVGTLCVLDPAPRRLQPRQHAMLEDLAAVASQALALRTAAQPPAAGPSVENGFADSGGEPLSRLADAVEQAGRTGLPFHLELPMVTATGRAVWVRTLGEVQAEDGRARRLFGAFLDVTAYRTMQAELAAANIQLRHLYERTPALLLSIDRSGTVLTVSDRLLAVAGVGREAVVRRPLAAWLCEVDPADGTLARLFEQGRCERVPYRLRCHDGQQREVFLSAVVEPGAQGETVRALAALEDVTETNVRTRELRREHEMRMRMERHANELNALLAERSDMLDVLAHEVRQPLNNASAALQSADAVLAQRGEPAAAEQLRRAQRVLHRVLAGVDNTLAESSLLVGTADVEPADVDLDMLLAIVTADMPAPDRSRVVVRRDTAVRTVWVEASLLRLALRNVLANALACSPPGTPVTLHLSDTEHPSAVLIDVVDHGPGISPALQARLFQRGARGSRKHGAGHGLGLFIARRAMELQGGRIELVRSDATGTCMRLQIREP